jgi:hypothetical protein
MMELSIRPMDLGDWAASAVPLLLREHTGSDLW